MSEKLVNTAWRIVVIAMIAVGGLLGTGLLYQGVLGALAFRWDRCVIPLIGGLTLGCGVVLLCRYRNDLVCP